MGSITTASDAVNSGTRLRAAESARITSKYQVTIPQRVRKDLGTEVGDLLVFVKDEHNNWRVLRISRDPVEALRQAGRGLTGTVEEIHREFEEGWRDVDRGD